MSGIFISYRRADSPDATGRIYDRLVAEFGRAQVFKDIDSIPLGRDFRTHLNDIVGDCAAVLAIVGPHWTDIRDDAGRRRLEDADDFVRVELEAALARSVPVVPVLVGHAPMPASGQLPASLTQLAFRQSIEVRPDPDFHNDATRLVAALRRILDPSAPAVDPVGDANVRAGGAAQFEPRLRRRLKWMAAIAAVAVAGMIALLVPALRHLRQTPLPEMRVDIVTPYTSDPTAFELSPDGRQIVFVASGDGPPRLWLRSLASTTAQPLAGTEGAISPFWSPDGRSIGFFAGNSLKRLDLSGGAPRVLAAAASERTGTWNQDGIILIAPGANQAVVRISASGGPVQPVTTSGPNEKNQWWPYFLPDGRRFIYLVVGTPDVAGIYLGALDGRVPVRLTDTTRAGKYLPGWLLWERGGALVAQRLDLEKAALTGNPIILAQDTDRSNNRTAVSVSSSGMIAYRMAANVEPQLYWFDRSGRAQGALHGADGGNFRAPRLSPDGRRVVAHRGGDLWVLDGTRTTRFTFDTAKTNGRAVWSPDGARISWDDSAGINSRLASGAGATQQLVASVQNNRALNGWSPDGRFLLYQAFDSATGSDLWVVPRDAGSAPTAFLKTRFDERGADFSPDGRWVAYYSDESGRYEVYVRQFAAPVSGNDAGAGASRWQVSTAGGVNPVWQPDGKAIYYLNPAGAMMTAPVAVTGATPEPGNPVELFPTRILGGGKGNEYSRQYDVAPDGRFLINSLPDGDTTAPITLVQNWSSERK